MVKIGLVGTGYWGPNLVRNFSQLPSSQLVKVCDLEEGNLKKILKIVPGVYPTKDYRDLVEDGNIDAIVIAAPAATHYRLARQALEHGKHVMVEKPLSLTVKEARELVEIGHRENKILMVGHLLEYHPAVRRLKELIDSGEMGTIYYLYSRRVNLGKFRSEENALWSFAPHDISVALYLLGDAPVQVTARGECYLQDGVEDVAFLTLHFQNKIMAHIHVSWLDPYRMREFTIVGSKKMVQFDDTSNMEKIKIFDKGAAYTGAYEGYGESLSVRIGDILIPKVDMKEPLREECQHFLDCVMEGSPPQTDGESGLRVVQVLEAAQKSMKKEGAPVKL